MNKLFGDARALMPLPLPITTIEWEFPRPVISSFKVMGLMVPQLNTPPVNAPIVINSVS